jgi:hypothetical protein
LTGEVLRVCEEAGIPCIVADESVRRLMKNSEAFTQIYLIVKTDDLPELHRRLSATTIPNRAVEGMMNNDWYPDLSLRYVDTATTCYYEKTKYRYPAVGVCIVPLRKKVKRWVRRRYDRLEHWDLGNGRRLYPKLLKLYRLGGARTGDILSRKGKRCSYRLTEFKGLTYLSLEETVIPITRLDENRRRFGYKQEHPAMYLLDRPAPITKADGDFVNKANPLKSLLKYIKDKMGKRMWKRVYPINRDWNRIHCVNERDLLRLEYQKKKPLILELYKNRDKKRLAKELYPYHQKLVHYFKLCKITIVFDREIYDIYKEIYGRKKGNMSVRKLKRHIPAQWRKA